MGYDYDINYKKGKQNTVADAIFRKDNPVELCNISGVHVPLLDAVKLSWPHDSSLQKLLHDIHVGFSHKPRYKFQGDV